MVPGARVGQFHTKASLRFLIDTAEFATVVKRRALRAR